MKLALVSPLPPTPSGIADYAAELLPFLAGEADLRLVVDDPVQLAPELARRFAVHATGELAALLRGGAVDLPLYMLGNAPCHAKALHHVVAHPGLLLLHDPVLHHLHAHLTTENGWREAYRARCVAEWGARARDWPERLQDGPRQGYDLHRMYYRLPLSRHLANASLGVAVHSAHAIRRLGPLEVPVRRIAHPVVCPKLDREAARARLGLAPEQFAVGLLGGLGPNRLPQAALRAFAAFAAQAPGAVLWIGDAPDPALAAELRSLGIEARFWRRPGFAEYLANVAALDVVLALRFPTCGETSGTALRAMSVGVPFVTTDVDAYRELPDAACAKVPVDRRLVPAITAALLRWYRDPAARRAAGAAGLEAARTDHRPADTARALVGFARELLARPRRAAAAAPRAPTVEAVVISYNGRQFIGPAIRSLLEQDWPALRVTVVDNASSDGSAAWLREQFPSIQVVASPRNLGFAAGNNLAFARSDADWFFLLNQDAVAQPDCVRELVTVGERRADIAVLGAKMLMQRCPTILNSAGIRINEAGWAVDRRIGEKDLNRSPLPENVFGACGGAMLLRASALRECGAFDERFFMYFEDVDLCWRLRLAGWHVWYVPTAVVLHDWHGDRGAGDRAARRRFLCERNRWLCLFKNARVGTIRRLWRSLRSYDRERLATVRREIARGVDVDYFRMVGSAIRRAWRWNLLHLPGTLLARARVQRLRRRGDSELARWIEPGVSEPSHVGDLTAIRDRFTAVAVPALVIGKTDQDSLGPGWHPREGEPGGVQWRWTKGEAWCYLRPERAVTRLRVRVGGRPMPGRVELAVDGELLPAAQHDGRGDVWLEFECPRLLPAGEVVELCLRPETFVPQQVGLGADTRELGIAVIEIRAE